MCNPTEQDFHSNDRFDDPGIVDGDRLLRHLCIPVQIIEKNGILRISDQAFKHKKRDPGTSVDLECLLIQDGLSELNRRGLMPRSCALIAVSAGSARQLSNGIAWTPKPEEPELGDFASKPNKYHGEIIGPIANCDCRTLAGLAELIWVIKEMDLGPFEGQFPDIGDNVS